MTIEFNHDARHEKLVNRWAGLCMDLQGISISKMSATLDLAAANGVNGNAELDLDRLAAFKDFDFMHDMSGIARHINRETGKLEDYFLPRCAK